MKFRFIAEGGAVSGQSHVSGVGRVAVRLLRLEVPTQVRSFPTRRAARDANRRGTHP